MRSLRVLPAVLAALALLFAVQQSDAALSGNLWVSLDTDGNQSGSASGAYTYPPSLSDDGVSVAMESIAPLVPSIEANGMDDVFVRDTDANTIELISASADGKAADNRSYGPSISASNSFVAFESLATNLTTGDDNNNASDVFLRDRAGGTTTRVSAPADGGEADSSSFRPSVSGDGQFVAFCSRASNLAAGDDNGVADAFLWERATGAITRIPIPGASPSASDGCLEVSMDNDGSAVAFSAVSGGTADVFVYDRASGATSALTEGGDGPSGTGGVSISGDGRFVAFDSVADNLIEGDTNRSRDVFLHDREAGTTSRVSVRSSGSQLPGDSGSSGVSISRDGGFTVFGSTARGVVPGDSNGFEDVFRHDNSSGRTTIASVNVFDQSANNSSYSPSVNGDGSVVAFTSLAANIAYGDGNRQPDVFLRGANFPEAAGDSSGPEETGAPEDETTAPVTAEDNGIPSGVIYGGIAGGVVLALLAISLLLGRRGRA